MEVELSTKVESSTKVEASTIVESSTKPDTASSETFAPIEKNQGEPSLVNNNLVNASEFVTNPAINILTNEIADDVPYVNNLLTTTSTTTELGFVIYGLYPNGTIVRKYPNGTIIPETTNITENSPDDEKILNDIISRNTIFKAVNRANNEMYILSTTSTSSTSIGTATSIDNSTSIDTSTALGTSTSMGTSTAIPAVHTTASSVSSALPFQVSTFLFMSGKRKCEGLF